MRNPFRRKAITATPNVVGALRSGWRPIQLLGSGSRERIQSIYTVAQNADYSWCYQNSPALRAVVDVITRNVGQLELRLYEEVSQAERAARPDHPAALSLRYPNETQPSDGFLRALFKDYLIHDNSYAVMNPAPAQRYVFLHIPTYMVEVEGNNLFVADGYRIWNQGAWGSGTWGGAGDSVPVPTENMLHWHGENPTDPRVGLSILDTLRQVIAEDAALQAAISELAASGLTEPVYAFRPETSPELTPRTRMMMEEDLGNRLRSVNRRPIVLEEGTEFRSFGVSPRDAEMMEVRRWALTRIAAAYGVPSSMVGIPSGTGDTAEMAQAGFYADCLMPICKNFTKFLNHRVLVKLYDWPEGSFEFNLDEKLMGDQRLTALVSASGRPVLTTNEARAMVNRPPLKYGDELITPSNVIQGDPSKAPKPSPGAMPIQDANKPPQDGSARTTQPPTPIPSGNQGKAIDPAEKLPQLHPRRSADAKRQEENIAVIEKVVRKSLNRIGRAHAKTIAPNRNDSRGYQRKAADLWPEWTQRLQTDLLRVFKDVTNAEANTYLVKLAGTAPFDMGQVEHYLEAKASGAADAIMEKVRKEVNELGPSAAFDRVEQHAAAAGGYLGVTTTTFARTEAAKQAPFPEHRLKTWVADTQRHAALDGVSVPLDGKWAGGLEPGVQSCRCTITVT